MPASAFVVRDLTRDDLSSLGYDANALSDEQMDAVAMLLKCSLSISDFWETLGFLCETCGIPRKS